MTEKDLKIRTRQFALDIIALVDELPRERVTDHIARQLLRCGTSVGANYRAACRGRSDSEMAAKLGIVEEEADESMFWMEMLVDTKRVTEGRVSSLIAEADELLRIVVTSIKTIRARSGNVRRVREGISLYRTEEMGDEVFGVAGPQSTIHNPQ